MHAAALRAAGIDARYEALDVLPAQLPAALAELRASGTAGNVTIPHKRAVMAACGWLGDDAAAAGAVNTFWWEDGALCGDNTDVAGFDRAARALLGQSVDRGQDIRVALLGAGGAAAAALLAVTRWPGASVRVWNRTPAYAEALAASHATAAFPARTIEDALDGATLVVNATSVGMDGVSLPVEVSRLPRGAAVLDLVYREGGTRWVRDARRAGHRASDGLAMLVEQGALAFERWFSMAPDRRAMWAALGREMPEGP